jgi:hypothetical protein
MMCGPKFRGTESLWNGHRADIRSPKAASIINPAKTGPKACGGDGGEVEGRMNFETEERRNVEVEEKKDVEVEEYVEIEERKNFEVLV